MEVTQVLKKNVKASGSHFVDTMLLLLINEIENNIPNHVYTNEGITNEVLNNFLCQLCSSKYLGVFNIQNEIPMEIAEEDDYFMIINVGKHFVLLYADSNEIVYIDPFGNHQNQLPSRHFTKLIFFSRKATKQPERRRVLHISDYVIQEKTSIFCGLYCMLFALYLDNALEFPKLKFSIPPSVSNDKKCLSYLLQIIQDM
jgi:hypothetical protein